MAPISSFSVIAAPGSVTGASSLDKNLSLTRLLLDDSTDPLRAFRAGGLLVPLCSRGDRVPEDDRSDVRLDPETTFKSELDRVLSRSGSVLVGARGGLLLEVSLALEMVM